MPINKKEILNVVSILTKDKNVRVTVRESVKVGCITGAIAATSALLLGPIGFLAGVWYSWVVNCFHKSWEYI